MAVIALTGASGFIGRWLRAYCEERGHEVRALTRRQLEQDGPAPYTGADCVIHLAARAHVLDETERDPAAAFRRANLELTQKVFTDSVAAGVKRFVFMSSAGVLGNVSPPGGFTDDSPPNPHDDYSRTKAEAEAWLRSQAGNGVAQVIIRPPVVHGPGARGNFGRILRAAERGWPLPVGGLHARRGMVGIRNLCDLTLLAALDPRADGATLLVADSEALSVRDMTILLQRAFGRSARVPAIPAGVLAFLLRLMGKGADVARLTQPFVLEPTRAGAVLGWRPPHSCQEELAWTVDQTRKALAGRPTSSMR